MYTGPRHTLSMGTYMKRVHSELGHVDPRLDGRGTQQVMRILTILELGRRGVPAAGRLWGHELASQAR
jgi:hypothetical protein